MVIRVAVCDDEKTEADYLAKLTREWAASRRIGVEITAFGSAEAFLFEYDGGPPHDILLLDINMSAMNGVELAKRVRAGGGQAQIVFVTGLPDFIAEGYEVSALHYLMKPVSAEKFYEVLDRGRALVDGRDAAVVVDTADGAVRLRLRDIMYAEAFARSTAIKAVGGAYDARASIGEVELLFGDGFFRVHRSYLAAFRHMRQITKDEVVMDDGARIPLSRRRYDAVNREFIKYYKGIKE